jgi:hypothetical protein
MEENKDQKDQQKGKKHKGGGMGLRGVSRPMAEKQMRQHQQKQPDKKHSEGPDLPQKSMWSSENRQPRKKGQKDHKQAGTPDGKLGAPA